MNFAIRSARTALAAVLIAFGLIALPFALAGCDAGTSAVAKSVADRVLPTEQRILWAETPQPDSFTGSYDDASGSGQNFVYEVPAADERGAAFDVTIISFGRKASGTGYLQIDAKGTSGVHYHAVDEKDVPAEALDALGGQKQ